MGRQHGGDGQRAGQRLDGPCGGGAHRLELRPALWIHLDGEKDVALLDRQAGNHVKTDDVSAPIRVLH